MTIISTFKILYILLYLQFSPIGAYDTYYIFHNKEKVAELSVIETEHTSENEKVIKFQYKEDQQVRIFSTTVEYFDEKMQIKDIKENEYSIYTQLNDYFFISMEYDIPIDNFLYSIEPKQTAKLNKSKNAKVKLEKYKLLTIKNTYNTAEGKFIIDFCDDGLAKCVFVGKNKQKITITGFNNEE